LSDASARSPDVMQNPLAPIVGLASLCQSYTARSTAWFKVCVKAARNCRLIARIDRGEALMLYQPPLLSGSQSAVWSEISD
jgi:hypothetical protein